MNQGDGWPPICFMHHSYESLALIGGVLPPLEPSQADVGSEGVMTGGLLGVVHLKADEHGAGVGLAGSDHHAHQQHGFLYLLEADQGDQLALLEARRGLVHAWEPGGQTQESTL